MLLIFLLCISLSSAFNNYSTDLFYYGLRYQILLTIFFFVGKSEWFADWKFFDKMQMPIIAVSLIGLYLYLAQPSWYIAWKLQSTTEFSSESRILEMTRLSAFGNTLIGLVMDVLYYITINYIQCLRVM